MKKKYNKPHFKNFNINYLNINNPISLKYIQDIVNNISKRYPDVKKHHIALICKTFIEEIREQLLKGNTISILDFLHRMRLHSYCKVVGNNLVINTRVQVNTPRKITKYD